MFQEAKYYWMSGVDGGSPSPIPSTVLLMKSPFPSVVPVEVSGAAGSIFEPLLGEPVGDNEDSVLMLWFHLTSILYCRMDIDTKQPFRADRAVVRSKDTLRLRL
jgi:hypothetical protein